MVTQRELRSKFEYFPDTGRLFYIAGPRKGKEITYQNGSGYKRFTYKGNIIYAHRAAWCYMYGEWPDQVDHINGNPSDNRLCNLREVDHVSNHRNCKLRKDNTSGYVGVRYLQKKKKWQAYINPGRWTHIGHYETLEEAVLARKEAERKHGFHKNHGRPRPPELPA